MNNWLKLARKIADRSNSECHKLGAVVVRGGAVVSRGFNLKGRYGRCAERRALKPHMDLAGCTLYVVRSNGHVSKPCGACMRAVVEAGIKWLVYVNQDRETVIQKVSDVHMPEQAWVPCKEEAYTQERW